MHSNTMQSIWCECWWWPVVLSLYQYANIMKEKKKIEMKLLKNECVFFFLFFSHFLSIPLVSSSEIFELNWIAILFRDNKCDWYTKKLCSSQWSQFGSWIDELKWFSYDQYTINESSAIYNSAIDHGICYLMRWGTGTTSTATPMATIANRI